MKYFLLILFLLELSKSANTFGIKEIQNNDLARKNIDEKNTTASFGIENIRYSREVMSKRGKPDILPKENHTLKCNLQVALSTEVEYLLSEFEYVSNLLSNLYRGDELQLEKYEIGFPFIIRTFEDAYLEKIIKFMTLTEVQETQILHSIIESIFIKIYDASTAYTLQINGHSEHGQPEITDDDHYISMVFGKRLEALEINLLQFLYKRERVSDLVFQNKEEVMTEILSLQTQFNDFYLPKSLEMEKIGFKIQAVANFLDWIVSIGLEPRPLMRADGLLAERIDKKLHAISACLQDANVAHDIFTIKALASQTYGLAKEFKLYGFPSNPFIDNIVRKFSTISFEIEKVTSPIENARLRLLFNEIALRNLFLNFKNAHRMLMDWIGENLHYKIFQENVESLNTQMKIWVSDLQLWNLPPSQELADLHELAHLVADILLSVRTGRFEKEFTKI